MSDSLKDIVEAFASGTLLPDAAADALLKIDKEELSDDIGKKIRHSAREIQHYAEQAKSADTPQWQASFLFELDRSIKDMRKHAKKILKDK